MKTAESLQIRGLINPEQSQPSAETSPALYNDVDDSCIPLRKRKRKFSTNMDHIHHQPFQNDIDKNCSPEEPTEPTDLSLPKGNNGMHFFYITFSSLCNICLQLYATCINKWDLFIKV